MQIPLLGTNPSLNLNMALQGRTFVHVDAARGSDASRRAPNRAFATLQAAVDAASAGAAILVAPGQYDETVTIPRTKPNLVLIGIGGRGGAYVEPTTEDAGGMVIHADDVTLINLGVAGEDTTSAVALTVTGARFRAMGCKFEGGLTQLTLGPGTDAQITADTHGDGADALIEDCEFTWGTNGVILKASDYGAVTQARFRNNLFRNLSAAAFEESGGSADIRFRDLLIQGNIFAENEGAPPTKYISLNDDNGNDGLVVGNYFQTALNSGLNLVSTALIWAGNMHIAGLSNGQPS
jgi:hypothetical protein